MVKPYSSLSLHKVFVSLKVEQEHESVRGLHDGQILNSLVLPAIIMQESAGRSLIFYKNKT